VTLFTQLSHGLLRGSGSELPESEIRTAGPEHLTLLRAALEGALEKHFPLVERFDGGAILQLLDVGPDKECVVALTSGCEIVAVVVLDSVDADGIYAHMAKELNLLGGECQGCGKSIPTVYEWCHPCIMGEPEPS